MKKWPGALVVLLKMSTDDKLIAGATSMGKDGAVQRKMQDWGFILAILGVVALALFRPGAGSPGGLLRPELTTVPVVMLLFFLQGLHLPTRALLEGWRSGPYLGVSLLVMFLLSPLFALLLLGPFGWLLGWDRDLLLGILFLALLPTTVATSTIYTDLAGGDRVTALYNAGISNLLALLYVPWVIFLTGQTGEMLAPPRELVMGISAYLFLPFVLGQVVRHVMRPMLEALRPWTRRVSHAGVLYIFYCALAGAVAGGEFALLKGATLLVLGLFVFLFYAGLSVFCRRVSMAGWFAPGQRIGLCFTWPQKSVALGVPLASVLFPDYAGLGVLLLPLLIYHPLQLIHGALLAAKWARNPPRWKIKDEG